MEAHGLVIGHVPPSLTFTKQKLGVEAPCYDRIHNQIVVAVDIGRLWKLEEVALSRGESCPEKVSKSTVPNRLQDNILVQRRSFFFAKN